MAWVDQLTLVAVQEYLRQRNIEVADCELKRWHPDFPLHEVADVPVSPLPAAPKSKDIASAQEVLARLQHKMESEIEDTAPPVIAKPPPQSGALKGVSVNLIEKVRAVTSLCWFVLMCCVVHLCAAAVVLRPYLPM